MTAAHRMTPARSSLALLGRRDAWSSLSASVGPRFRPLLLRADPARGDRRRLRIGVGGGVCRDRCSTTSRMIINPALPSSPVVGADEYSPRHVRRGRWARRVLRAAKQARSSASSRSSRARLAHRPAEHARLRDGDRATARSAADAVRPRDRRRRRAAPDQRRTAASTETTHCGASPTALLDHARGDEDVARVGGDEFAVLSTVAVTAARAASRSSSSSSSTASRSAGRRSRSDGENALALYSRGRRAALRAQGGARLPPRVAVSPRLHRFPPVSTSRSCASTVTPSRNAIADTCR